MNIPELYELVMWVERELGGKKVPKTYGALHSVLQNNTQAQPKQPFEQQRDALITFLRQIDLGKLTLEQIAFLERLGIAPHLGEQGAKTVEDILYRNQLDVATAAARIDEITKRVTQGVTKATQIKTSLDGLVETRMPPTDEALLRVTFARDASMNNVEDFKRLGADWHDIGRGIAIVHGHSPRDVRVVGATTGSIIVELAVIYAIAGTVASVLLMACKVADRVLDLKKKAEEIRGLRLHNDKIPREIEEEAEQERTKGVEDITAKVLSDLGKSDIDGDQKKALDVAVRKLLSFVQKGGEVDCVLPPEATSDAAPAEQEQARIAELKRLRETFRDVRTLESKIRQLEVKPLPAEPE